LLFDDYREQGEPLLAVGLIELDSKKIVSPICFHLPEEHEVARDLSDLRLAMKASF
jgi:hypothetical protein